MVSRKKPISGKAKKQQLSLHRAQKQAKHDLERKLLEQDPSQPINPALLLPATSTSRQKHHHHQPHRTPEERARDQVKQGRLNLESRFLRLPPHVIQHHRQTTALELLPRPVPADISVLCPEELDIIIPPVESREGAPSFKDGAHQPGLSCPKRPKWSYNSTKREVEKNEEGYFAKWLRETDGILKDARRGRRTTLDQQEWGQEDEEQQDSSPTFFERNLQVWRQLWRVCEVSAILLILIDVRFPLIHYPASLSSYLATLKPAKKVILVLTKTDLVPPELAFAWQDYFRRREKVGQDGGFVVDVVLMESYKEVERTVLTQGTHARLAPSAPSPARHSLLTALRLAHSQLLTPPPIVSEHPERLAKWDPKVRKEVDWDGVEEDPQPAGKKEKGKGKRRRKEDDLVAGISGEDEEREEEKTWDEKKGDERYPFITVGLIGQPNVGKSSLLNALLGRKVVRASRTPGKTKTLQTIYWNSTVRLCDCPGLVCPSLAGMERQVLSGILPIQNVELVLHFIAQRMPLERILSLTYPDGEEVEVENKTKKNEFSLDDDEEDFELEEEAPTKKARWTTDAILTAFAQQQGFITAKAARPDLYRAGSVILRQLHSSVIPWGYEPPLSSSPNFRDVEAVVEREGLWIKGFQAKSASEERWKERRPKVRGNEDGDEEQLEGSEFETEQESSVDDSDEDEDDSDEGEESDDEEAEANENAVGAIRSVFAGLEVEGGDSEEEESEE
ncbi:P-loop containing nucleoside triphosphate hydrolase protein [Meredithblackwellia eburnea MCA 4105]